MRQSERRLAVIALAFASCTEPSVPAPPERSAQNADASAVVAPVAPSAVASEMAVLPSSVPAQASASAVVSASSRAPSGPTECRPGERRFGTTCCESRGSHEDRFPGQVFLDCHGPQIGKSCKAKKDCDVACFCGDASGAISPRAETTGPKDGTTGVTGVCAGRLQVGVWMCQIDEAGKVTHVIVD